jgi:hypothetical protein
MIERSHFSAESYALAYYAPSSGSISDRDMLGEDDHQAENMCLSLPSGRKTRTKGRKTRAWYDGNMIYPKEQPCLWMCFANVY